MTYDTPTSTAYAVLYSILSAFTILAIASADLIPLPSCLRSLMVLNTTPDTNKTSNDDNSNPNRTPDFFLSARNSASATSIALSFFASGMGAWVVYGTTEMGATPQLSWLGVIGYSAASAIPALIIAGIGPRVRDVTAGDNAFSTTDFARLRYGRVMQLITAAVSVFYMFIYIVAELTSISNVYGLIVGKDTMSESTVKYTTGIAIAMGAFTVFYTTLAGLPASIVTDKFQGAIMALLVLTLTIAVSIEPENHITKEEFALASNWTVDGLMAAVTLFLAIASAEMFNQGTWQRVWAARSVKDMRRGFVGGSVLVFLLMMFFGVMGMIGYAKDPEAYDNWEKWAFLAFFDLLEPLSGAWHVLVLVLVTALAASSIDSLQNALTCIFSHDLVKIGWNPKWITRILLVGINIPAIFLSAKRYDVISLFLVADLVCATSVFPVFLGLIGEDLCGGMIVSPTELGAVMGCISGVAAVVVNGIILDYDGGLFDYFWLQNGAMCALCGSKTMITFIITPAVSALLTLVFSKLDVMVRGDRARKSIFLCGFDQDDAQESKAAVEMVDKNQDVEKVNVTASTIVPKFVDSA